jgi:hypothetical protein
MSPDNRDTSTICGANTSAAVRYGATAVQRPNLWDRDTCPKIDPCPRACPENNPYEQTGIQDLGQWDNLLHINLYREKERDISFPKSCSIKVSKPPVPCPTVPKITLSNVCADSFPPSWDKWDRRKASSW